MTNREIIIALVSSIVSGFIVWAIQQSYLNRREKRKENEQRTIKAKHTEKVVTDDIFYHLSPGKSIELMKEMLGVPARYSREDNPVFSEEVVKTNSYFYIFKNAFIKITSKDNDSIDSLTVFGFGNPISMDSLLLPEEIEMGEFGKMKVTPELVEHCRDHTFIHTMKDASFAIEIPTPGPLYLHYTFFGYAPQGSFGYREIKDPKLFIGGTIDGVCLSYTSEDVYFIYDNEQR